MARRLRLRGGKSDWYRNRFVIDGLNAPASGRPAIPDPRNGAGYNVANTNIVDINVCTYASAEAGGPPVELTYTLDSIARSNLAVASITALSPIPNSGIRPTSALLNVMPPMSLSWTPKPSPMLQ
jgi:carotenoid cleavage dioxygenase-like enzyme